MSRSFIRDFFKTLEQITTKDTRYELNKNKFETMIKSLIIGAGLSCHCVYALGTSNKEKSTIVKKYKMVRNGFTEFMVIDEKGRHFNLNNSLWYWKWDSIEDWSNIKEGDDLYFKYYGWRVPVFGLFPNIYMTNHAQFLDSMTSAQFRLFEYEQAIKINT
jgi:hypothetical protein